MLAILVMSVFALVSAQGKTQCNLSDAERQILNNLIVPDNAESLLKSHFILMWSSQVTNPNHPYCINWHISYDRDTHLLKLIAVIHNLNNLDKKIRTYYLDKIRDNVYLVKKLDGREVSLLYIVFSNLNVLGIFKCKLESTSAVSKATARIQHNIALWVNGHSDEMIDTEDKQPKMGLIAVQEHVLEAGYSLPSYAQTAFDNAKKIFTDNSALFGQVYETKKCKIYPDI